jgi:hypothetical protein
MAMSSSAALWKRPCKQLRATAEPQDMTALNITAGGDGNELEYGSVEALVPHSTCKQCQETETHAQQQLMSECGIR